MKYAGCPVRRAPCHQNCKHLSYSNFTVSQFLNESNTKLLASCIYYNDIILYIYVTTQSQVLPPLNFFSYCPFTALPALSALHQRHAGSNSDASSTRAMAFSIHTFLYFISHIWNSVPQDTRHSLFLITATLSPFKNKLKT